MTKLIQIAFIGIIAITSSSSAAGGTVRNVPAQEQIAGGYGDTANDDPEVLAAARFAISAQSRKLHARIALASIKRAEVQVVAGLNYRICMTVKIKRKRRSVTVIVYKDLKQKYSLTSWTKGGCESK